jgi:hypothetical protein
MENVGKFDGHLDYFMTIWHVFMDIWYILWPFGIFFLGMLHTEKSGNPETIHRRDFICESNLHILMP